MDINGLIGKYGTAGVSDMIRHCAGKDITPKQIEIAEDLEAALNNFWYITRRR